MKNIYFGIIIFAFCLGLGFAVKNDFLGITIIDTSIQTLFASFRTSEGVELMKTITTFGESSILTPIIILSLLYFLLKKHWEFGVILSLGIATAGYLVGTVKNFFELARPTPHYLPTGGYGFPSGHTSNIAIVCFILMMYFMTVKSAVIRYTGLTLCVLGIVSVAISRMYLNVHWFTDVVGGAMLALSITLLLYGIVQVLEKKKV